jgi:chorismate mutase/prephenate dehydratase
MAERKRPVDGADGTEPAALRRLRRRIDALDRRIVRLLNERAELAREVGRVKVRTGRRAIRDPQREREILLRVSMANEGPTPQADLLAIYKRLFTVARSLERRDRLRERRAAPFGEAAGNPDDDR